MKTYSSLSLAQVSKLIESPNVNATRDLVANMVRVLFLPFSVNIILMLCSTLKISTGELSATLSSGPEGELTFNEDAFDEAGFSPEAIHNLVLKAQAEQRELVDLGKDMNAARAVLAKVRWDA